MKRFAIDAIPIIGPTYTLMLLLPFFVFRKKSVEIRQNFAKIMLFLSCCYIAFGYCQNQKAINIAKHNLKKAGFDVYRIRATPTLLNIWVWKVIAHNKEGDMKITMISTLFPSEKIHFYTLKRERNIFVAKAFHSKYGKILRWFSMDMLSTHTVKDGKFVKVYIYDQRYGTLSFPAISVFRVCMIFDLHAKIYKIEHMRRPEINIEVLRKELSMLWNYFKGETIPLKMELFF